MKQIVIAGGGYGGVAALQQLAGRKDLKITLIDQHPYHFLQTEGYALIAGTMPFDKTIVNLHTLCYSYGEHVTFLHGGISHIDFDAKCVHVDNTQKIEYDYIVVATGSVTRFLSSIEGLQSCSYGIKSLRGALQMKQFFEKQLFERYESAKKAKKFYSIVIGGAGLSGVEIAADMQHYFNRYYKSNTLACDTLQIHLISGSQTILKGSHPKIIEKATQRLEKLGVIIHTGAHISQVEPHKAFLEDGKTIAFDYMLFTGGIIATSMVREMDVEHNRIGQIMVDPYFRVPGKEGAFAVGDAAEVTDIHGNHIPDTAQVAIKSGIQAGENIARLLDGKPPKDVQIKILGLAIALGGKYAILDIGAFRFYGIVAHYGKKLVENFYKWPLWLRCRYGLKKLKLCNL